MIHLHLFSFVEGANNKRKVEAKNGAKIGNFVEIGNPLATQSKNKTFKMPINKGFQRF